LSDNNKVEIGYVCSHGHYVFYADPEEGGCASKRIAGIFVEQEAEFYEPFEEADEDGHVWFASCGYSEEDYTAALEESEASLGAKIDFWRKNA
jgi:hypothetical protein